MTVKKILVVQLDGPYFLEETFRVLEKFHSAMKDFELTVLVSPVTLREISSTLAPLITGITVDVNKVLSTHYDISFNLSLDESSWELYNKVSSGQKLGFSTRDGQLIVPDHWSTFLLTVKANPPFLTFHLQDIYRNILGIKKMTWTANHHGAVKEIAVGNFNELFLTLDEREKVIKELRSSFPNLIIKNIMDVDLISDLSHTLYIGPSSIDSLRMGEAGARGLYLSRSFQGFNLLPHLGHHYLASTRGQALKSEHLMPLISGIINQGRPQLPSEYSLYEIEHENLFGAYLKDINHSDSTYPFYQSHVVLWNFLLNLFDVNLDIVKCTPEQIDSMKENQRVLTKLLRLHDYALSSVDFLYNEAKSESSRVDKIEGHLKNLREMDEVIDKISVSHPMLRPFLDFYRIRRGQNDGVNLIDQIQHTFLTYSEEHHALTALSELFSVTLRKNEVSI